MYEPIETQRDQLKNYQALITEHAGEYSRIGQQLYKKDTLQSALKTLIGIVNSLEDIDIALKKTHLKSTIKKRCMKKPVLIFPFVRSIMPVTPSFIIT
jgi:hypothetical protein